MLTDDDFDVAPALYPSRKKADSYVVDDMDASQQSIKSLLNISSQAPTVQSGSIPSTVGAQMGRHVSDLKQNTQDLVAQHDREDQRGESEQAETTEVAVINAAGSLMANADDLEWYPVDGLPGVSDRVIKIIGKTIFSQYTTADMSQLFAASTPTNPENDVARIMVGLQKKGTLIKDALYDFEASMPGYVAEAKVYQYKGLEFLLVKDLAGHYVYAWDSKTSLITSGKVMPQLTQESYYIYRGDAHLFKTAETLNRRQTQKLIEYSINIPALSALKLCKLKKIPPRVTNKFFSEYYY